MRFSVGLHGGKQIGFIIPALCRGGYLCSGKSTAAGLAACIEFEINQAMLSMAEMEIASLIDFGIGTYQGSEDYFVYRKWISVETNK